MKFTIFLFLFFAVALLGMTLLPSFLSTTLPFLEVMAAVIMLAFLAGGERFWFGILAGFIFDLLHAEPLFSHMPMFVLVALFFWLWDVLVKFEEPILTISRLALGFLIWPFLLAMVMSLGAGGFQARSEAWPLAGQVAAMESFFSVFQVLLGRDVVFGLLAVGAAAAWRIYAFRRERLQNLSHL